MTTFALTVDGEPVPIHHTITILQADPFPRGHTYRWVIKGAGGLPLIDGDADRPLSHLDQWGVLFQLDVLVGKEPGEVPPASYVLNTVDRVVRSAGQVIIEGICSPVVTDWADRRPDTRQ